MPAQQSAQLRAGENFVGKTYAPLTIVDVTLSLDVAIYADGDVLAAPQEVPNAIRVAAGTGVIENIIVIDEDDLGVALDLVFFDSAAAIGAENAALAITDADARKFLGLLAVAAADFVDLGGSKLATKRAIGLPVKAASGRSIYVGAITRGGTPTYSAAGIRLRIAISG